MDHTLSETLEDSLTGKASSSASSLLPFFVTPFLMAKSEMQAILVKWYRAITQEDSNRQEHLWHPQSPQQSHYIVQQFDPPLRS